MMIPKTTKAHWLTAACAFAIASTATANELKGTDLGSDASLYGLDPYELSLLYEDAGADSGSFRDALQGGKAYVNFRLRHEEVDADAFDKKAHATTLRTVLGYETAEYDAWTFHLEFDDIHFVAYDAYNGGGHFRPGRPTVADPQGAGLNQANVKWHGEDGSIAVIGRQKIEAFNERWIGDVGWRQNDQTYDAAVYHNPALGPIAFTAAYVRAANTVTAAKLNVDGFWADATYVVEDVGKATIYDLNLNFDDPLADGSTNTLGVFFDGNVPASDDLDVLFRVEFANQTDTGDSDLDVDTDYTLIEVGAKVSGWTAKIGQETLGGADGGDASLQTPLATKHSFNGWADVFLTTPAAGLVDTFVEVGTMISDVNVKGVFHDFAADDDIAGDAYGTEIDLVATKKLTDYSTAGVKLASYSADDLGQDVTKAWIWATYSF